MKVTDFSRFRAAVTALNISIVASSIVRTLETEGMDIERDDIIPDVRGLYGLIEKNGLLFVTRIILHIFDYKVHFLKNSGNENAFHAFNNGEYDAPELRQALHKYHLVYCQTLDHMFKSKLKHRYKQSRRQDGKFRYMFIDDDTVKIDRKDQKLNVCKNCLSKIWDDGGLYINMDSFLPSSFFENVNVSQWLPDCGYEPAIFANFIGYPNDFKAISKRVREKRKYRCEQCGISLIDDTLQEFLHCHHKDRNPGNSKISNLLCLCIRCHAEQPMHGHMKNLPDYQKFLPIWEARSQVDADE